MGTPHTLLEIDSKATAGTKYSYPTMRSEDLLDHMESFPEGPKDFYDMYDCCRKVEKLQLASSLDKAKFEGTAKKLKKEYGEVFKYFNNRQNVMGDVEPPEDFKDDDEALSYFEDDTQRGTGNVHVKVLQPRQMMTRLPILLTQLKAGNSTHGLLGEICQIAYSLLRSGHMTNKIYDGILKFIKYSKIILLEYLQYLLKVFWGILRFIKYFRIT